MRTAAIIAFALALCLAAPQVANAAVDRQLRTFEDSAYSFENDYFRTGSTIYFRALGTAEAVNPVLYVQAGGFQIEVPLNETSPGSGIYRGSFRTDPTLTNDAENVIKTFNGAIVELRSDIDRDGIQGTSDVKNVTMDDSPPGRPRLCDANATPYGSVRVNWTEYKGTDFRRYTIVRALNEDFSDALDIANITDSLTVEYYDPEHSLLCGLEYWYGVKVIDLAGNPSQLRATDTYVVPRNDTTAPVRVTGLATSAPEAGNSINLTWSPSPEADVVGYVIFHYADPFPLWDDPMSPSERRYNPLPPRVPAVPPGTQPVFTRDGDLRYAGFVFRVVSFTTSTFKLHRDISANYDHYYIILALDERDNWSPLSDVVTTVPDDTMAPGAPKNLGITTDETGYLNLTWAPPSGESVYKYVVYRAEQSMAQEFWDPYAKTNKTFYLDNKVEHGKTYFYVVRSIDAANNEETNTVQVAMTSMDSVPPPPPRNLKAVDNELGGRIKLTWSYASGERPTSYQVFRVTEGETLNFSEPIATVSKLYYEDRGVEDNVLYTYAVRSVDAAGNVQPLAAEISVVSRDLTPPAPAKNVYASPMKGGAIRVVWSPPWQDVEDSALAQQMRADVDHYVVYWNTYAGFQPDPSRMLTATETVVYHEDVVNGKTYYYIVRTVDAAGNENTNDPSASAVADTSPPGSPTNFRTYQLVDGRIKLDWDAPAGEVPYRYNIYRAGSSGGQTYGVMPFSMTFDKTEWIDDNVTHGQWYYYVVRSSDFLLNEDQNTNEKGNVSNDQLPPGPPTQLRIKNLPRGDVMINWTEPEVEAVSPIGGPREADRAVKYRIYSSTSSGGQDFERPIAETPNTYFTDKGLRNGQDYCYVVRAVDAAGNEDQNRAEIRATADASPPSPPVNVLAQRSPKGEIILTWDDPEGEAVYEYRIYKFTGNETQSFTEALVITRKSLFVDNDVSEAVQYRYVVRSVDEAGNEGRNTIETLAPILLGPPQNLVARPVKNGAIELSWNPPAEGASSVQRYNIYRSLTPGLENLGNPWDTTVLTRYTDQDRLVQGVNQYMVHGTRYYYTVRAVDLYSNEGIKSEEVSAVSDKEPPSPPKNLEALPDNSGNIQLRWQTPAGERVNSYRIYRSTRSGGFNFITPLDETSRIIWWDETTVSGQRYFYVVRSVDEAGNEEANTAEIEVVALDEPPGPPTNLRAQVRDEGTVVLTWNTPSGETISRYNIYRSLKSGEFNFNEPYAVSTVAAFTDTAVAHGTTYYYVVRAVDTTENEERNENQVSALSEDRKPPLAPVRLTAAPVATGTIRLNWERPAGEVPSKYRIYRGESPFFRPSLQNVLNESLVESYTDGGLDASKTYYYIVRSFDAIGNEDQNENRVQATTPPAAPLDLSADGNEKGEIVLLWRNPESPVYKYRIYRAQTSGGQGFSEPLDEVPYPTTSYLDGGLNHSFTYYYIVRSVDASDVEETNEFEVWAQSLETVPPLAPSNLTASQIPAGGIRLSWSHRNSRDVSVYNVYRSTGGPSTIAAVKIGSTNITSFDDLDTISARTYSYLVRAVDIHGNEEVNTKWISMISIDTVAPAPPTNLTASPLQGGAIELKWKGPEEANVTYRVYRSLGSDVGNFTAVATTNSTSYLDANLINGREYFYIIRALDSAGNEEENELVVSAVASKSGPRILLALVLLLVFILGGYAVDKRRRLGEAEAAR